MPDFPRHSTMLTRNRFPFGAYAACLLAALMVSTCSTASDAEDTIDRAVFIQAYVELRMSALDTDSQRLADPARDSILTSNGITVDALTRFATIRGEDPEFMTEVWAEVESRLDQEPGSRN
jgi:hypothetical protein